MKQKLLLLLLGVLLALPALARDFKYTYEGQTITYTVIDEKAKTCKTKEGYLRYEWDIPEVRAGNPDITDDLKLPSNPKDGDVEYTLTSIGSYSFSRWLTSVEIPNSVTSISDYAFYDCNYLGSVEIPNSVTSIGNYAFYDCYDLGSVEIPNSVTSIGNYAFYYCMGMTSVEIPNSVTSIGIYAFSNCSRLTSVVIPNSVPFIRYHVFSDCSGMTSVEIPNSVTWIGEYAFSNCSRLTSVEIPNSVQTIDGSAFSGCRGLTSVLIPNSVTGISDDAFSGCNGLIKSAYPNTLEDPFPTGIRIAYNPEGAIIEDGWIWGPDKSTVYFAPLSLEGNYTIPEYVTAIGEKAFAKCDALTEIKVSQTTPASMKDNSFDGLYDKVKLSVPDEAVSNYLVTIWSLFKNIQNNSGMEFGYFFSDGVFEYRLNPTDATAFIIGAKSYRDIQIPERFTDDSDPANPVRYYIKGIGYKAFDGKSVNSVEFSSRSVIEYIGDYAFAGSRFSSISLPETVSYIGESAFRNNTSIRSIAIPEKVTEIKDYAFYNCTSLTDVQLNGSLESIGAATFSMDEDRFDRNKSYGSLAIPASLKSIGDNAFLYRALDKVTISDLRAWCDIDFSNNDSNPCGWANDGFWLGENEIVDLVIPDGVIEVKPYSFVTMGKLKSVKIPASVTSIGEEAFYYNPYISTVVFPNNLKSIGDRAFYLCCIPSVSIPASVDYIGHEAFITWGYPEGTSESFTKYLTSFTLEDGLNPIEIEADAFAIPTSYTGDYKVRYNTPETFYMGRPLESLPDGFQGTLANLTIGNTIESVSDGMFANCSILNKLKLGSSIQSIGDKAFRYCSRLKEVILPPSVETIGESAFAGDSNLETIIMGHKVTTIGEKAFDGCKANTVSITAQTPPTAPNNTFSNYLGSKLYVQGEKAKEAYYDAFTCWDRFDSYVMIEAEEIKIEGMDKIVGKPGDTFQLTATIWPENVTLPQIFWRSTNPEIATVDENGLVTLHADLEEVLTRAQGEGDIAGTCTIIAETLYNDGPMVQVTVDNIGFNVVEGIQVGGEGNGSIDYSRPYDVYNMEGLKVSESKEDLPGGIYIIRQGKAAVKTVVK